MALPIIPHHHERRHGSRSSTRTMRSRLSFPTTLRWAVEVVFDVLEARTTVSKIAGDVTSTERVCATTREHAFPWGGMTASCGVAQFGEGMDGTGMLLVAADEALYRAKEKGRDRVARYSAESPGSVSAPPTSPTQELSHETQRAGRGAPSP